MHKHKTIKYEVVGEQSASQTKKRVKKLHHLKTQPIFSEASITEPHESFDNFYPEFSSFPLKWLVPRFTLEETSLDS